MQESPLGFEYTWADLQPIRALAVTVLVAQLMGGALGLAFAPHSEWFLRLWIGGTVVTFPAFVLGLFIQSRLRPGSIGTNLVMVRRLGLIAAILTLVAVLMPELGITR
jgi:uncharacterized membrane protein